MQGLQHQNRGHHRRRDRRPPLPRRKQVLKILITEQLLPTSSEEPEHAVLGDQMTNQSARVQKLTIHPLHTLHEPILPAQRHILGRHADYSAPS